MYWTIHLDHAPLSNFDGYDLRTDNTSFLARWSEHLQSLFKPTIETKARFQCHEAGGVDVIQAELET